MNGRYEDLLYLPHPTSRRHPRMSMQERAAQFSPFAALRGYGAAIRRAGQPVAERIEPDEETRQLLERRQRRLLDCQKEHPLIEVLCFGQDGCQTICGSFQRIDEHQRLLVLTDRTAIPLDEILSIEGAVFDEDAAPSDPLPGQQD